MEDEVSLLRDLAILFLVILHIKFILALILSLVLECECDLREFENIVLLHWNKLLFSHLNFGQIDNICHNTNCLFIWHCFYLWSHDRWELDYLFNELDLRKCRSPFLWQSLTNLKFLFYHKVSNQLYLLN